MKIDFTPLRRAAVPFAVFLLVSCAQAPIPAAGMLDGPQVLGTVSFASSEVATWSGPLNLTARLSKPEGEGPFPAVVLLHGCSGMQPGRDSLWARRIAGWG